MAMSTARELFVHELSDTLSAENQIYKMLGKVVKETKLPDAKDAYENHREETKTHIAKVEAAFEAIGEKPERTTCLAAKGLGEEHDALAEEKPTDHALELGLLGGAGKTEHYEIASYRLLVQMAKDLGETKAAGLLQENLDEELAMSKTVETLAKAVLKDAKTRGPVSLRLTSKRRAGGPQVPRFSTRPFNRFCERWYPAVGQSIGCGKRGVGKRGRHLELPRYVWCRWVWSRSVWWSAVELRRSEVPAEARHIGNRDLAVLDPWHRFHRQTRDQLLEVGVVRDRTGQMQICQSAAVHLGPHVVRLGQMRHP